MTFSDAIVIYLACGSPFAVHALMIERDRRPVRMSIRALISFTCWPMLAARHTYRLIRRRSLIGFSGPVGPDTRLQLLLIQMENAAGVPGNNISIFDVRNTLDRYTGLAAACFSNINDPAIPEIFNISGHPDPEAAAACLSRCTRSRLTAHLNQAREEFITLAIDLDQAADRPGAVQAIAIELTEALGDKQGRDDVRRVFMPRPIGLATVSNGEIEQLWSTEQATTTLS